MVLVYVLQRVREVSFTTMKTLWRGFLISTDLLYYRHSFSSPVVYYRQSWEKYLAKNCADNVTVPITRRSYVAGDCQLAEDTQRAPRSCCQNHRTLYAGHSPLCHLVAAGTSWSQSS